MCDNEHRAELLYPAFTPGIPDDFKTDQSIFDVLRKRNILLQHPYQSFTPVVDFIAAAAADPAVLAIKQTLYRTGSDSPIVDHLVDAARERKLPS